jgi:hypothetical protein
VNDLVNALDAVVPLQGVLGYLNFSTGKPDPRFQKQLSDAFAFLAGRGDAAPWQTLPESLRTRLRTLQAGASGAFRDTTQAEAVLRLAFGGVLPAYRRHHADLLFHQSDADLFQPFFAARVCEAVLSQGGPWDEEDRTIAGALRQLNDFVGHRPIAILETRPRAEPYEHERVRPIPLYLRGAGVAWGRYQALITAALDVLARTDPSLLADASFNPDLLDELAFDPRAYDHGHPVNRRPNYVFGEWDPHHLDNQGRYRRFVVRQITLDALLDRVANPGPLPAAEALQEAATVLAGVILMAAGSSGPDPTAHDSTTTLATLVPRIARYRDAFYMSWLRQIGGEHGQRLRQEATLTRQPFGGARQHLNHYLAGHRAAQMQERHLALLFAELGQPEASRERARRIPTASLRFRSELAGRLTTGHVLLDRGDPAGAAAVLPEAEDLLRRGIACGALADPWNVLGFQGLFPLTQAREDSVRDPRIDDLIHTVEESFRLYARLLSEAAAAGQRALVEQLLPAMRRLVAWWDRFATVGVSDVRHVLGGEAADSAEHVATALARWHERGEATADLAFWRQHLEGFRSPKAFALVVEALLRKEDHRAAMALLMNWLSQVEQVPLEDGEYSFHGLALRWMLGLAARDTADVPLLVKFFDYLEANADEYWNVPELAPVRQEPAEEEADDSLFSAAYEGVTFRDSADDNEEGSVADGGGPQEDFDLDAEGDRLGRRLHFLSTVAKLWVLAARQATDAPEALGTWLRTARAHREKLLGLLDAIHAVPVTDPLGSYDSLVEYDRRRLVKEQVTYAAIGTCLDMTLAVGALQGALASGPDAGPATPGWEPLALRIEQALLRGDAAGVRGLILAFLELFKDEPLLFTALADGGDPRQILRARLAQNITQALAAQLPELGLIRETYLVLRTAREMERTHPPLGRSVTEFNHLFEHSYRAVVEAVLRSVAAWDPPPADEELVQFLERLTEPFLRLWIEHSRTMRLAALEGSQAEAGWQPLVEFVKRYGGDLFHAKFMTLANLRGILHRGMGPYLDFMSENPDPLHPVRLIEDLDNGTITRGEAESHLRTILQAVAENYEEYKDYNTTTTQSDYGENLYVLLDFLRLKASYERHTWEFRPLVQVHEALARHGRESAAVAWEEAFAELTGELADDHLDALAQLEQQYGVRLRTVADRMQERFIRPLAVDRLAALIEPAMQEARQGGTSASFRRLQEQLEKLAATPTGVGLDVPPWLRRLEAEVQRVNATRSGLAVLVQKQSRIPKTRLSRAELEEQLAWWTPPAEPET